jgi:FMN phosphatase YigB (HAD superfamily)
VRGVADEIKMIENGTVYLFDVDNTLLDNDRVTAALHSFLDREVGKERSDHYWQIFEELRTELGYADYLGALQRYRAQYPYESHVLSVSTFLINYPFANRLFPRSLDVLEHFKSKGTVVILTDGDAVFQPRKLERSGIMECVDNKVLIYVHKEHELHDVERRYPAERYVLFDDKLRILDAIKQQWNDRVATVFVRQGHYATDLAAISKYRDADFAIGDIGDALSMCID